MKRSKSLGSGALWSAALVCFGVTPSMVSAPGANRGQRAIDPLLATYENGAAFRALTDQALGNVQPLAEECAVIRMPIAEFLYALTTRLEIEGAGRGLAA